MPSGCYFGHRQSHATEVVAFRTFEPHASECRLVYLQTAPVRSRDFVPGD